MKALLLLASLVVFASATNKCAHVTCPPGGSTCQSSTGNCVCPNTNCGTSGPKVCASTVVNYNNKCLLDKANCASQLAGGDEITSLHNGTCVDNDCNSIVCTDNFDPVCGSDLKTYPNQCSLGVAICHRRFTTPSASSAGALTLKHTGECSVETDCAAWENCPTVFQPVCGSNYRTYSHSCKLSRANCESQVLFGISITKKHNGACNVNDCPSSCAEIYDPVCGTDVHTYSSSCFLNIAICNDRVSGQGNLDLLHAGECTTDDCPASCADVWEPVCGSDGQQYSSSCYLEIANCQSQVTGNGGVTQACAGVCAGGGLCTEG